MKITKDFLKNVIAEEFEKVQEAKWRRKEKTLADYDDEDEKTVSDADEEGGYSSDPTSSRFKYERERASDKMAEPKKGNLKEMKILKTDLKRIIKEEYDKLNQEGRWRDPMTYDQFGEPAGRGPAGMDVMDDYRRDEAERIAPKLGNYLQQMKSRPELAEKYAGAIKKAERILKSSPYYWDMEDEMSIPELAEMFAYALKV